MSDEWIYTDEQLPPEPEADLCLYPSYMESGASSWDEYENDREVFIDEHFEVYIVQIEGASRATTLYYIGNGEWMTENMDTYPVTKWQELPQI